MHFAYSMGIIPVPLLIFYLQIRLCVEDRWKKQIVVSVFSTHFLWSFCVWPFLFSFCSFSQTILSPQKGQPRMTHLESLEAKVTQLKYLIISHNATLWRCQCDKRLVLSWTIALTFISCLSSFGHKTFRYGLALPLPERFKHKLFSHSPVNESMSHFIPTAVWKLFAGWNRIFPTLLMQFSTFHA